MKKRRYRELHSKNNEVKENKKEKSTVVVENKKENIEKEKKGFNVFFDTETPLKNIFKDDKKKSSDD